MDLQLKDNNRDSNGPMDKSTLMSLVDTEFQNIQSQQQSINDLTKILLERLNKNSSQYKYIVTVTTLKKHNDLEPQLEIDNVVGASWNSAKDGFLNHQIVNPSTNSIHIVTILWVAK